MANEDLGVNVHADASGFVEGIQHAEHALEGFLGSLGSGSLGAIGSAFASLGEAAAPLALVAGAGLAVKETFDALGESVEKANEWNVTAGKLSRSLGITTQEASVLANALEDHGVGVDTYQAALGKVTQQLVKGGEGFASLGVKTRDSSGNLRNSNDILQETIAKLNALPAGTERNTAATAIFGRSWVSVQEILRVGREELAATDEQMTRLGTKVTPEAEANSRKYKLALADVHDVLAAFAINLGNFVIPTLTEFLHWVGEEGTKAVESFRAALETTSQLITDLKVNFAGTSSIFADFQKSLTGTTGNMDDLEKSLGIKIPTASEQIKKSIREIAETFDLLGTGLTNLMDRLNIGTGQLQGFFNTLGLTIHNAYATTTAQAIAVWHEGMGKIDSDNEALIARINAREEALKARQLGRKVAAIPDAQMPGGEDLPSGTGMAFVEPHAGGKGNATKDTSGKLFQQWKEELDKIKVMKTGFNAWSAQDELDFWQKKLAITKEGTEAHRKALAEVAKAKKDVDKDALAAAKEKVKTDTDEAKRGLDEQVHDYERAEKQKEQAAANSEAIREAKAKGEDEIAKTEHPDDTQSAIARLKAEEVAENAAGAERQRQREQELQKLAAFEQEKLRLVMEGLVKQAALAGNKAEVERINREMAKAEEDSRKNTQKLIEHVEDEGAKEDAARSKRRVTTELGVNKLLAADRLKLQKQIEGYMEPFVRGFSDGFRKILDGTISFSQAIQGMGKMLAGAFSDMVATMVTNWLKSLAEMAAQWLAHLLFQNATSKTEGAAGAVSSAAVRMQEGAGGAALGAINAAASVAAVPFVGWAMAPEVMAQTYAMLMGMVPLTAAAQGFDVPSGLNPITQLHAQEMVLPAPLANVIRDMARDSGPGMPSGGGGSSTTHVNIQALDGPSVARVLRGNERQVAKVFRELARDGKGRRR